VSAILESHQLPLGVVVGLDVLAARLNRLGGPGLVVATETALGAAGQRWLDEPAALHPAPGRATRLLWLGGADGAAPADLVAPGGLVGVLADGPLAALLARRRAAGALRLGPAPALPAERFGLEERVGVGGPATLLFGALAGRAERAGRDDLADRFAFLHRRSLAPRPGQALAERLVLVARRRG
jgi:hypothetical protein